MASLPGRRAPELLDMFVESFDDEPLTVKLTLLTATVKLFLKRPGDTQVPPAPVVGPRSRIRRHSSR